ncbi:MAG TPA: Holliday junction branch migration protein RuvA [Desulfotomaculum sp.]|nr:MAG: Holliday junction ATP-dependent DNA helicase RuvA [Desulfotomaculum sp. 46_80]HAG12152.1 Holliday junction branch migration protein RuvA [Desulfotomaculum sp.]HBY04794.1 Holliday junction branch migration protein RuvA [Desulfotomaculum sp.]
MISFLKGILDSVQDETIIIDVNGIGFSVQAGASTIKRMPPNGDKVKLYTYLHSREEGLSLYGFYEQNELELFRLLIGVSGVGPKAATILLSSLDPEKLKTAIARSDAGTLKQAPGIGKKTAERIILELKDKILKITPAENTAISSFSTEEDDALAALVALGYGEAEAQKAIRQVLEKDTANNLTATELVRTALKK